MMKENPVRRALNVAAGVILALCGCDSGPVQVGTNGRIRGTVTDNTGDPMANAAVALSGSQGRLDWLHEQIGLDPRN